MKSMKLIASLLVATLAGCTSTSLNQSKMVTAFAPHIDKDGAHTFTFIANKDYPTFGSNLTPKEMHEQLISSELGTRQFCTSGYEIVSATEEAGGTMLYKGKCK